MTDNNDAERTPTATIRELSEEEAAQVARSIWSRLQKKLVTRQAIYLFLSRLIIECGIGYEWHDDGILVLEPEQSQEPQKLPDEPEQPDDLQPTDAPDGDVL